ncbi:uncharacterized protein B0H18DRAFT_1122607 [Fomitopsis serialis]|uniref:uncharacterized protein n=1 Tax=Fomitopsis serialis TaxID=139415 RepID=UPI0020072F30|nr:uncharacterized protein B0H18DRAFT_1122607 [Neoantrodia serialis]KAH9919238.1 hypothetical protein B0H18DRAFT_1122607 [Neoantrodia serialis]
MNVETSSGPGKRSLLRSRSDGEILNSATTYVPNPGPYLTPPTTPHSFRDGTDLSPSVPRLRALSNREHARSRLAALHDGSIGCRRAVIPADQCSRPPSQRNLYATTASTRGSQPPSAGRPARVTFLAPWRPDLYRTTHGQPSRQASPLADAGRQRDRQMSHADKCRTGTRLEGEERPPNRKIREEVRAENTASVSALSTLLSSCMHYDYASLSYTSTSRASHLRPLALRAHAPHSNPPLVTRPDVHLPTQHAPDTGLRSQLPNH